MKNIEFTKMHGLGNDFVIIDTRSQPIENKSEIAKKLADRRLGIGCDQVILIEPSDKADIFMRILNVDGSEPESCGNATRCVADILFKETGKADVTIDTLGGLRRCWRADKNHIRVDMGAPLLEWQQIPLARACDTLHMPVPAKSGVFPERLPVGVNVGNPHCVFFVDDLAQVDIADMGPDIEHYELFPARTNVEWVQVLDRNHVRMRVWERGAGVTMACGSGACAAVVAAIRRGLTAHEVRVTLDGGDLMIEWNAHDKHIYMTGPIAYVFTGQVAVTPL